jgi:hypothetical protein
MVNCKLHRSAVTQHLHTDIRGLPPWHASDSQPHEAFSVADYRTGDVLNIRIIIQVYSLNRFLNIE